MTSSYEHPEHVGPRFGAPGHWPSRPDKRGKELGIEEAESWLFLNLNLGLNLSKSSAESYSIHRAILFLLYLKGRVHTAALYIAARNRSGRRLGDPATISRFPR